MSNETNGYFEIVEILLASDAGNDGDRLRFLRDWTFKQSPKVRWLRWPVAELQRKQTQKAALGILIWPACGDESDARSAFEEWLKWQSLCPLLVVEQGTGGGNQLNAIKSNLDAKVTDRVRFLKPVEGADAQKIGEALSALKLTLPPFRLQVHPGSNDRAAEQLLRLLDPSQVAQQLQRYFPDARQATVTGVAGGWSGAPLCRVNLDDLGYSWFVKFFKGTDNWLSELRCHQQAKQWLGNALVDLRLVPDLDEAPERQLEAFPGGGGDSVRPICYKSADADGVERVTLAYFYRGERDSQRVKTAFRRLLRILSTGQPTISATNEMPWDSATGDCFRLDPKAKGAILDCLDDLDLYGADFNATLNWQLCRDKLERLVYMPSPTWLSQPSPFARGHIHGDPNARNCLVNPANPADHLLIDCGGYRPNGRRVSDLALIERDLKLLLLNSDCHAPAYRDLDPNHLVDWCRAEDDAIGYGLGYPANFPVNGPWPPPSVRLAYELIAMVRAAANQICPWPHSERHYFAALLYWTLEALQHSAIRRTKKLLAIYSAARILQQFP